MLQRWETGRLWLRPFAVSGRLSGTLGISRPLVTNMQTLRCCIARSGRRSDSLTRSDMKRTYCGNCVCLRKPNHFSWKPRGSIASKVKTPSLTWRTLSEA